MLAVHWLDGKDTWATLTLEDGIKVMAESRQEFELKLSLSGYELDTKQPPHWDCEHWTVRKVM